MSRFTKIYDGKFPVQLWREKKVSKRKAVSLRLNELSRLKPASLLRPKRSLRCNLWKGTDLGSLDPETGEFVRFFHPRRERWIDHFALTGALIRPLTPNGRVTVQLLKLNLEKRFVERQILLLAGRYPR